MYQEKKLEIKLKLIEINEIINNLDITLNEYDDIKNAINNAKAILNGRYDALDYVIQENQIDQCINSLNNMINNIKKRKKKTSQL